MRLKALKRALREDGLNRPRQYSKVFVTDKDKDRDPRHIRRKKVEFVQEPELLPPEDVNGIKCVLAKRLLGFHDALWLDKFNKLYHGSTAMLYNGDIYIYYYDYVRFTEVINGKTKYTTFD